MQNEKSHSPWSLNNLKIFSNVNQCDNCDPKIINGQKASILINPKQMKIFNPTTIKFIHNKCASMFYECVNIIIYLFDYIHVKNLMR